MSDWPACPRCANPKPVGLVDRDLDCLTGWRCEACGHAWPRSLAETLSLADPSAFKEPHK